VYLFSKSTGVVKTDSAAGNQGLQGRNPGERDAAFGRQDDVLASA
jgi:hypothetical protein